MSKIIKDDIDHFYDYDLYAKTRTIYIGEQVDAEGIGTGVNPLMAEFAIKGLHLLSSSSNDPITILMNNPGGNVYDGLAIYDAIKTLKDNYIIIKAFGHVMSMGSIIFQAADDRVLAPNTTVMLHYGTSGGGIMHSKDSIRNAEEEKRINTWMEDLFIKKIKENHPSFSRAKLQKMINFDCYLTAEETIELGLADKIM